jgi:hypothetical protein
VASDVYLVALVNSSDVVDDKISEMSGGFFGKFRDAFLKYYRMFEHSLDADLSLRKIETQNGQDYGSQRFMVNMVFKKKRAGQIMSDAEESLFDLMQLSKKQLSKGKKIVYVLCLILALNAIEPVS